MSTKTSIERIPNKYPKNPIAIITKEIIISGNEDKFILDFVNWIDEDDIEALTDRLLGRVSPTIYEMDKGYELYVHSVDHKFKVDLIKEGVLEGDFRLVLTKIRTTVYSPSVWFYPIEGDPIQVKCPIDEDGLIWIYLKDLLEAAIYDE